MNDISGAVLEDPDSTVHHAECSFVIQVRRGVNIIKDTAFNCNQSQNLSMDAEPNGQAAGGDLEVQEVLLEPQPYHLQALNIAERDLWMHAINSTLRAYQRDRAEKVRQQGNVLRIYQLRLRSFYNGLHFQTLTALLVAVNFFFTVIAPYARTRRKVTGSLLLTRAAICGVCSARWLRSSYQSVSSIAAQIASLMANDRAA
jgi:hypothetical protein